MHMTRFSGKCYLTLILTLLHLATHAERIIFCKIGESLMYSNVSNKNFLINHNYYLFFENMQIVNCKCNVNCPVVEIFDNKTLELNLQLSNFRLQEDLTILFDVEIQNKTDYCEVNITFIDKLDDIIYTCPNESYFTIEDNGYKPRCNFTWCSVPTCNTNRKKYYFSKVSMWDIDDKKIIYSINPSMDRSHYHIKFILDIYVLAVKRLVGSLNRIVTAYLINGSKYVCFNQTGKVMLVNILEIFDLKCNYTSDIPFLDDKIKLRWGLVTYSKWFMNYTFNFNPNYLLKPYIVTMVHIIIFLSDHRIYYLKKIIFIFYVKFGSSLCNKGKIYEVISFEKIGCYENHPYPEGFYIKIQNISNQIPESIQIDGLKIAVLKNWIPDILTILRGKMFIKDLKNNLTESEKEIMDFRMLIIKIVIHNLKILPESLSINLPDKIIVLCQTKGVPVISYFWTAKNFSRSFNECSYIIVLPQLNYTYITIFVSINYEYYWYNVSKIYLIGRIPSLVIITSKFPKLSQNVLCYTDGENSLYTFQWMCNDSNEPKDLIAVDFIRSISNDLIFHETAPLVTYNCLCMSKYHDVFNRQIFAISADVELHLQDNDMIDCELAKSMMDETTWTIFVIYILIFFMIPSVFFLIAYFVTDGRIKSIIQSKIFNRLGFIKKANEHAETIPFFIIAKSDVGEMEFNQFLKIITDFDRTVETIKIFRQMSFQFRFSKTHSNDHFLNAKKINNLENLLSVKNESDQWEKLKSFSTFANKGISFKSNSSERSTDNISPFSKLNYMSSFGKSPDDSSMSHHRKTVGLQIHNSPFLKHKSSNVPQKKRKSFSAVPNSTSIRHLKSILDEKSEKDDMSSFKTISSKPINRIDSMSSPKPKRQRFERERLFSFENLSPVPLV